MTFRSKVLLALALTACNGGEDTDDTGLTDDTGTGEDTDTEDTDVAPEPAALDIPDAQLTSAPEEEVFTLVVHLVDANGALASDATNEVTLTGIEGSISGAGDFSGTLTRAAVGGIATFDDLSWPHPETVTFDVTATDLTGIDDEVLTFSAKPFTHLVVTQQSGDEGGDGSGPVADANGHVTVFDIAATGDVAPLNYFYSTIEAWEYPWGIGFDEATGEILVSLYDGQAVARYPLDTQGVATPTSMLTPSSTDMEGPSRITTDQYHNEIYVPTEDDAKVYVFARDAIDDATPLRVLGGDLSFDGDAVDQVAIDYANDEIFVVGYGAGEVFVFNRTDDGNVAPKRTITTSPNPFDGSAAVVFVAEHNELIVLDYDGAIYTFDPASSGAVAPTRKVAGPTTGLSGPSGLAWDPTTDELFVADQDTGTVSVFNRTDDGDVAPKRTISGTNAVFTSPSDVILAR